MSDFPNGHPPGQNNLNAGTEQYVPKENDPSAGAQKPDADRAKEDGIVANDEPVDKEVEEELREASKNVVQPSTADEPEPAPAPRTGSKTEPSVNNTVSKK
jgi:hypothetical protein